MASKSRPTDEIPVPSEWVSMAPPKGVDIPEGQPYPRQPREAFDAVWSAKGWTEVPDSAGPDPTPVLAPGNIPATTADPVDLGEQN